jgi:hypothetical protein
MSMQPCDAECGQQIILQRTRTGTDVFYLFHCCPALYAEKVQPASIINPATKPALGSILLMLLSEASSRNLSTSIKERDLVFYTEIQRYLRFNGEG